MKISKEYTDFVKYCKEKKIPLNLTGNQQEFIQFLLENEEEIKMGVTTKLFDIVTSYFLFKK